MRLGVAGTSWWGEGLVRSPYQGIGTAREVEIEIQDQGHTLGNSQGLEPVCRHTEASLGGRCQQGIVGGWGKGQDHLWQISLLLV